MNKDIILTEGENNLYPLAHSDSDGNVIIDTYLNKNKLVLNIKAGADEKGTVFDNVWVKTTNELGDEFYTYTMVSKDDGEISHHVYPELDIVKESDTPLWDVDVDPIDGYTKCAITYKNQVKCRSLCTSLFTFDKKIVLVSMKPPVTNKNNDDFKLSVYGLSTTSSTRLTIGAICYYYINTKYKELPDWENICSSEDYNSEFIWWALKRDNYVKNIKNKNMIISAFYDGINDKTISGKNVDNDTLNENDIITFWYRNENEETDRAVYNAVIHYKDSNAYCVGRVGNIIKSEYLSAVKSRLDEEYSTYTFTKYTNTRLS